MIKSQRILWCFLICFVCVFKIAQCGAATLRDLGYGDGILLRGESASATVYFPLPAGATGATLTLRFASSGLLGPHAALTVLAGRQPVMTIPAAQAKAPVTVHVPARLLGTEFLEVRFAVDQYVNDGPVCHDDSESLWTLIDPDTSLAADTPAEQGVGAIWRQLGAPLQIAMPEHPSNADIETGLVLATALVERGIAPYFGSSAGSAIRIDPSATDVSLVRDGNAGNAVLVVPSPRAARALVAADSALRRTVSTSATAVFEPRLPKQDRLTFGSLGVQPAAVSVTRRASLDIPVPYSAIPAGEHVTGLVLSGRGEALPEGESEIVTVLVGSTVVWSEAFRGAPALDGVDIDLPPQLIASGARPQLSIVRAGGERPCVRPTPLEFRLSDASKVVVADGPPAPRAFAAFNVSTSGSVPVLLGIPADQAVPALPLVAELLAAAGAGPSAIGVGDASIAVPDRPFVLISHQAGEVVGMAPLSGQGDTITFDLPDRSVRVTLPDAANRSVLQLVRTKDGMPGLWLSPGSVESLAQAKLPGDGNIALYDGGARPATFDTEPKATLSPTVTGNRVSRLLRDWQVELIATMWLLVLVLVVALALRRRRTAR